MDVRTCIFVTVLASASAIPARAHDHDGAVGVVHFPVSCSARVQADFEHAVALLHHMTYPQARQAFQAIADAEPRCAMAHWGIAMTLFQPLWPTRPGPDALRQGLEEARQAVSLAPPAGRERLFAESALAFFDGPATRSYWDRIGAWADATDRLHAAYPQDPEATVFRALALLATSSANQVSRENADRAAALLLEVYRRNPDHPGAMHYLVHANDVPGREHELLDIVRRYEAVAPDNPHALHMPTHIYTRLGDWDAVIRGNLRSADAALKYPAGDHGQFVWDEFPHAIEYLVYAYLQEAADDRAAVQIERLRGTKALEPSFKTAFHLASTQARFALERRRWQEASELEPRVPATLDWDRFPWPEGVTWFARGLGAAHTGNPEQARVAVKRLGELESAANGAGEELFARNLRVLRLSVEAWLAHSQKDDAASLALMREAAELEAATPKHAVTPAPTLPAGELLGDLLLEQGQPVRALEAYERSLAAYPRRYNSLLGAARAARAANAAPRAHDYYEQLLALAPEGRRTAELEEARQFTAARPQ